MNCRDFLIEFEERKPLTETAALHLNDCPDCRKSSGEQTIVWQVIDCLEKVDAPKDFDFRLKARIANAEQRSFQPRFLPALRYVLPFSALVLIFAFIVFKGINFVGDNAIQTAEKSTPRQSEAFTPQSGFQPSEIAQTAPTNDLPAEKPSIETANSGGEQLANKNERKTFDKNVRLAAVKSGAKIKNAVRQSETEDNSGGGSHDLSSKNSKINILPEEFSQNKTTETSPNSGGGNSITSEQGLAQLGMEIVSENGNRRVKSIKQNSIAERSGVRVGDTIEAIDGKKVTGETTSGKTIGGKTLTVVRGAQKREIALRY